MKYMPIFGCHIEAFQQEGTHLVVFLVKMEFVIGTVCGLTRALTSSSASSVSTKVTNRIRRRQLWVN